MPGQKDTTKNVTACADCHERKVKCSGSFPCGHCIRRNRPCFYPPSQRKRRAADTQSSTEIESRLARMEALFRASTTNGAEATDAVESHRSHLSGHATAHHVTPVPKLSGQDETTAYQSSTSETFRSQSPALLVNPSPSMGPSRAFRDSFSSASSMQSPQASRVVVRLDLDETALDPTPSPGQIRGSSPNPGQDGLADPEESEVPFQEGQWEQYVPGSWMSVCSQPGQRWVCKRTDSADFTESARGLTLSLRRRLTIEKDLSVSTVEAELDEITAWTYVQAYFDSSYDSLFGVVNRPAFEARLRGHFNRSSAQYDEPSWVALRNVVYAAGCRCHLAKDPSMSFVRAQAQAWQYFEKAIAVFKDLIFHTRGLMAVQALALMTLYAEGLGSPSLEYLLVGNLARMAQYKGIHRQPEKAWNLPDADVLERNWLWWTVYALDKQIAFRSGRPSAIDDGIISVQIPKSAPVGSTVDVKGFTKIIEHARILSQICRRILTVEVFQQSPTELVRTVSDLHNQLVQFRDSIPVELQFGMHNQPSQDFQLSPRFVPVFYIHFALYGSLMATHLLFFYPWIVASFRPDNKVEFHAQVTHSSNMVADAAREIIRAVRAFSTTVAIPAWLAAYYPLYAHINLFVYLLQHPRDPDSRADLALLDICAGHFGHMEIFTSFNVTFPFVREAAALAAKTVKAERVAKAGGRGRGSIRDGETRDATPRAAEGATNELPTPANGVDGFLDLDFDQPSHRMNEVNAMDFDTEPWNFAASFDLMDDIGDFGSLLP